MFRDTELYPTPDNVIETMLFGENIEGKIILEPSAGIGNIVDYIVSHGTSEVIACEINEDFRKILGTKCQLIGNDFLKLESHHISHVNLIVMNPPFSADEKHILHAWEIAPPGCKIIALCNTNTIESRTFRERRRVGTLIDQHGSFENLGECFNDSDRRTNVDIGLVKLQKPGQNTESEFEGFFMEDDPEETQQNGLMPYNVVRDLVNRYVGAVKIFDEQLETAVKMNALTDGFYTCKLSMEVKSGERLIKKNEFKKEMQKSGWQFVFSKMNMEKYATKGLRQDINKFVETQSQIPFTMRNIYKMLEIVVGTQGQQMDKAILEVFDKLTTHYNENRYHVEGWKTNSHFLINQKFIMPHVVEPNFSGGMRTNYHGWAEPVDDLVKAMCYLTGMNYDELSHPTLSHFISSFNCEWGKWYSWGFFEIKAFKKGTMHFKFYNEDLWAQFNQRVAKLKGYPLYEAVKTKETARREAETAKNYKPAQAEMQIFQD